MIKIGIVGSRRRNEPDDLVKVETAFLDLLIKHISCNVIIISGGCKQGADHFAEMIAEKYGLHMERYLPSWGGHGKKAGVVRNHKIANVCDWLIAAPAPDRKGGTEYTINFFLRTPNKQNLILV